MKRLLPVFTLITLLTLVSCGKKVNYQDDYVKNIAKWDSNSLPLVVNSSLPEYVKQAARDSSEQINETVGYELIHLIYKDTPYIQSAGKNKNGINQLGIFRSSSLNLGVTEQYYKLTGDYRATMLESDIMINLEQLELQSKRSMLPVETIIKDTMTHEMMHFLNMKHSSDPASLMFYQFNYITELSPDCTAFLLDNY